MSIYPIPENGEYISITAPDGEVWEYVLDNAILDIQGLGVPPVRHVTSKNILNHGSQYVRTLLDERQIPITIFQTEDQQNPDRDRYWDMRAELIKFLNIARVEVNTDIFVFTVYKSDGTSYTLNVVPDPGPAFLNADSVNFNINEPIMLRAFDPVWKGEEVSLALTASEAEQLVFPITFPITFEAGGSRLSTGVVDYAGDWYSYPTVSLVGPYTTVTLQLNGVEVALTTQIATGAQRIIDFDPIRPTIVDGFGNSKFNELASGLDNVLGFFFKPEPPGSNQILTIRFAGNDENTEATVTYSPRYLGI